LYTLEQNKENDQNVYRKAQDKKGSHSNATSCADIHRAVNQSRSNSGGLKKKSRKCPGGQNHRMWESADQSVQAAADSSKYHELFAW